MYDTFQVTSNICIKDTNCCYTWQCPLFLCLQFNFPHFGPRLYLITQYLVTECLELCAINLCFIEHKYNVSCFLAKNIFIPLVPTPR